MLEFQNVSFSYAQAEKEGTVRNINLTIQPGEAVLLCGESGCGKTTLTRLINGLIPHYDEGEFSGRVLLNGQEVGQMTLHELAEQVGSVFQNPRSQFFTTDTTSELAFGPENLGMKKEEILRRIQQVTYDFELSTLLGRNIFDLSGGEKQKISCASVAALTPDIIVLDEPSSNLDTVAIEDLRQVLLMWKNQGKTLIIAEHRLHYLRDVVNKILYMKKGQITQCFSTQEMLDLPIWKRQEMGLRPFDLTQLVNNERDKPSESIGQLVLSDFHFAYKKQPEILDIDELTLPEGSVIAVIGLNGAGKSTLAQALCGLIKCGTMEIAGQALHWRDRLDQCYMVMQDVNHQIFTESVMDEVLLSMDNENEAEAARLLECFGLGEFAGRHPLSLSGGQKQRVAVACAVACGRKVIVFDEPTSGLDLCNMQRVAKSMRQLAQQGKTLLVVTHDPELILACCKQVLYIDKGKIKDSYQLDKDGVQKVLSFFAQLQKQEE